jgi:hypothetical protein
MEDEQDYNKAIVYKLKHSIAVKHGSYEGLVRDGKLKGHHKFRLLKGGLLYLTFKDIVSFDGTMDKE